MAIPEGSSSEAPVIMPGPSFLKNFLMRVITIQLLQIFMEDANRQEVYGSSEMMGSHVIDISIACDISP